MTISCCRTQSDLVIRYPKVPGPRYRGDIPVVAEERVCVFISCYVKLHKVVSVIGTFVTIAQSSFSIRY
jgi:hypothetical protein